jgi:hypothetical protein
MFFSCSSLVRERSAKLVYIGNVCVFLGKPVGVGRNAAVGKAHTAAKRPQKWRRRRRRSEERKRNKTCGANDEGLVNTKAADCYCRGCLLRRWQHENEAIFVPRRETNQAGKKATVDRVSIGPHV